MTPIDIIARKHAADAELDRYDFGPGVAVTADRGWDVSQPASLAKIVIAKHADDHDAEAHAILFQVSFDEAGQVQDARALGMNRGNGIGTRQQVAAL